jgi:transmembrane sensor
MAHAREEARAEIAMNSPAHEASERAGRWILRQEEPDWSARDQDDLDAWLDQSPLHRVAYLRQRTGWRAADRIASLGPAPQDAFPPVRRMFRARWQPWAAVAALILTIGGGTGLLQRGAQPAVRAAQTFTTRIGGRRNVVLPDRSRVELNTATQVRAAVSGRRRELWLDHGEAFFDVARRPDTPFVIHVGTRTITVLGTKFSIRRDRGTMVVSVLEGRVRVDDTRKGEATRSTTISGGDMAFVRDAATLVAVHAEDRVDNALVWRQGMLSFDNARLGDAVREFNRYHRRQIVIADDAVANMRIDGAFQAANVDAFTHLLRDAYGLSLKEGKATTQISN